MFARTYRGAVRQQLLLRRRLVLRGSPRRVRRVAGADISYDQGSDRFFAAVVVLAWPGLEVVEEATAAGKEQLEPFRERMPGDAYERACAAATERYVREQFGLPTVAFE